jgi:hypothetical protein
MIYNESDGKKLSSLTNMDLKQKVLEEDNSYDSDIEV